MSEQVGAADPVAVLVSKERKNTSRETVQPVMTAVQTSRYLGKYLFICGQAGRTSGAVMLVLMLTRTTAYQAK